jgi:hypothetical protein
VISLNLVLAGLRLGLKNRQVGEKWVSDDCFYLCELGVALIMNGALVVITVNASTPENTDKVIVLATHKGSASFTMRPLHRDLLAK